jgi:hypothetical protein
MPIGPPSQKVPKSGCSFVVVPMLATHASDRLCFWYVVTSVFHGLLAGNVGHGPLGAAVVVVVGAAVVVVVGAAVVVVVGRVVVVVGRVVVVVAACGFVVVVVDPVDPGSQAPSSAIARRSAPTRRMSLNRHTTLGT